MSQQLNPTNRKSCLLRNWKIITLCYFAQSSMFHNPSCCQEGVRGLISRVSVRGLISCVRILLKIRPNCLHHQSLVHYLIGRNFSWILSAPIFVFIFHTLFSTFPLHFNILVFNKLLYQCASAFDVSCLHSYMLKCQLKEGVKNVLRDPSVKLVSAKKNPQTGGGLSP